ncbi:MAG: hypothetical protein RBR41_00505 [Desulfovibrio sp.]|uniref:hypothetical protein n=1 Tax=Desulfovibrio sp. TaxID=885 RepID=UPI002A35E48F|nr:hypothetical protein [Desulfovibrio sp.]MDY0258133.1 hypothetical protein [Desulfovibrio sp.]
MRYMTRVKNGLLTQPIEQKNYLETVPKDPILKMPFYRHSLCSPISLPAINSKKVCYEHQAKAVYNFYRCASWFHGRFPRELLWNANNKQGITGQPERTAGKNIHA